MEKLLPQGRYVMGMLQCPHSECLFPFASHYPSKWTVNEQGEKVRRWACGGCERYFRAESPVPLPPVVTAPEEERTKSHP